MVLTVLMHFSPPLAKLLRLIVVSSCWHLPAPHLFQILLSCRCPNTPLAICTPCKSLRRGAAICAPLSRPTRFRGVRRRVGRVVPSKLIISVGERSERFRRVRALLAVGRVVLSN